MLRFVRKVTKADDIVADLVLTLDQRVRSRLRVDLSNGQEGGVFLERGQQLHRDDLLQAESGEVVRVLPANESVSTAYSENPHLLMRACYHLGNRHVALQIGNGFVRYLHDHVLDDMLKGLGLIAMSEQAPFEPESGAYGEHGHAQPHSHGHGHHHEHGHSHAHDHTHEHH